MPEVVVTRRQIAVLALSIAEGYAAAHVHEEGGNNRGDQVEFFQSLMGGSPGDPWCADFVCTCLVKGYARAHGLREDREWLPQYVPAVRAKVLPLSGSCYRLAMAARSLRMLHGADFAPEPGDLALFDLEDAGKPTHVGMVRSATATQGVPEVRTVEGNTSSGMAGSQRDGGGVYRRVRPVAKVRGFVHFGAV